MMCHSFDHLNDYLQLAVLKYLDIVDRVALERVNKGFQDLLRGSLLTIHLNVNFGNYSSIRLGDTEPALTVARRHA